MTVDDVDEESSPYISHTESTSIGPRLRNVFRDEIDGLRRSNGVTCFVVVVAAIVEALYVLSSNEICENVSGCFCITIDDEWWLCRTVGALFRDTVVFAFMWLSPPPSSDSLAVVVVGIFVGVVGVIGAEQRREILIRSFFDAGLELALDSPPRLLNEYWAEQKLFFFDNGTSLLLEEAWEWFSFADCIEGVWCLFETRDEIDDEDAMELFSEGGSCTIQAKATKEERRDVVVVVVVVGVVGGRSLVFRNADCESSNVSSIELLRQRIIPLSFEVNDVEVYDADDDAVVDFVELDDPLPFFSKLSGSYGFNNSSRVNFWHSKSILSCSIIASISIGPTERGENVSSLSLFETTS
jgi:hypothetical protein